MDRYQKRRRYDYYTRLFRENEMNLPLLMIYNIPNDKINLSMKVVGVQICGVFNEKIE